MRSEDLRRETMTRLARQRGINGVEDLYFVQMLRQGLIVRDLSGEVDEKKAGILL